MISDPISIHSIIRVEGIAGVLSQAVTEAKNSSLQWSALLE